jgi:AraC-like DNA-binding protein
VATIAITFWTAFLLLQDKRSIPVLNRWFAAFLFLLITPQLDVYYTLTKQYPPFLLAMLISSFLWLKGPFVWAFITVLIQPSTKKMWLHFLPWCSVFLAISLFPTIATRFNISFTLFPILLDTLQIMGMCHMLAYLFLAVSTFIKKRHYISDIWHGFPNTAFYWLTYIIGGLILLIIIDLVVISLFKLGFISTFNFLDFFAFPLFSVYALSIGILSVYRPELLFRESIDTKDTNTILSNGSVLEIIESAIASKSATDTKERHLELTQSVAEDLLNRLKQLMQEQQLYRQNELSLPELANELGISNHQVSELLNVHLGVSFYDYINSYRLEFASSLLKNPDCKLRILDIAFEAGFNNKNSFYRAFKESFGVTPNQYRENSESAELSVI